jgi:hypothetical protein
MVMLKIARIAGTKVGTFTQTPTTFCPKTMKRSVLKRTKGFDPRKSSRGNARAPFRCDNYGGLERRVAKRLGTAKPREGGKRDLEKRLESLNARFVKLRDEQRCVQCLEDGVPNQGVLDAGHLYPKSVFRATRLRLEVLFSQCRYHNLLHCRRPEYFLQWFQRKHGEEALERLHELAVSDWRPDREWLVEQIAARERAIADMELLQVA